MDVPDLEPEGPINTRLNRNPVFDLVGEARGLLKSADLPGVVVFVVVLDRRSPHGQFLFFGRLGHAGKKLRCVLDQHQGVSEPFVLGWEEKLLPRFGEGIQAEEIATKGPVHSDGDPTREIFAADFDSTDAGYPRIDLRFAEVLRLRDGVDAFEPAPRAVSASRSRK